MANNPQKQNPQNPQALPEHVVLDISGNQPAVAEQVQHTNGAQAQQAFQQSVQQGQPQPVQKPFNPATLDPAALDFYASIAQEKNPQLANALRAQKYDNTYAGGFKRTMSHRITIGDVLIVSGVVVGVILLWEGIAYKFDMPRFGLFDPTDPVKAMAKK